MANFFISETACRSPPQSYHTLCLGLSALRIVQCPLMKIDALSALSSCHQHTCCCLWHLLAWSANCPKQFSVAEESECSVKIRWTGVNMTSLPAMSKGFNAAPDALLALAVRLMKTMELSRADAPGAAENSRCCKRHGPSRLQPHLKLLIWLSGACWRAKLAI